MNRNVKQPGTAPIIKLPPQQTLKNIREHQRIIWIIAGACLVVVIAVLVIVFVIFSNDKKAWSNANKVQFDTSYSAVKSDYLSIATDFKNIVSSTTESNFEKGAINKSLVTKTESDCTQLQTDVSTLKSLPKYPVSATNTKLQNAVNNLSEAAKDCITGLRQSSVTIINQSATGLVQGSQDLIAFNNALAQSK